MKKKLPKLLALLVFLLLQNFANAQYNPNLLIDAGNPGNLNATPDTATTGWTAIKAGGASTNSWSAVQNLPFSFAFYGNPVTAFKASSNGLITFTTSTATLPNANVNLPTSQLPDKTIACFWDAFSAAPPLPANSKVYTKVFGTAGSRQLWIKWVNYEIGNPVCAFANFACVLEEGTNKVFMVDMNYSSANVTATIGLQQNATQALQFGSNTLGFFNTSSGPAIANNDYYEFTPQVISDAGVLSIDAPTMPFGSGTSNVLLTLKNFSQHALSNVTIKWKVNNVQQPDFVFNGSVAPYATVSNVNIGSYNFVDGFNYIIEAETFEPNGSVDVDTANDKKTKSVCPMLLGNYTIGGPTGDFATITEAVNMLHCAGVEMAVNFTLAPGAGPFNETISLSPVVGASAVNTITFNGGANKEKISSVGAHTFKLNGADYITLENLTIENLHPTSGAGVLLVNQADHNIVRNCYFPLKAKTNNPNYYAGVVIGYGQLYGTGSLTGNNGSFNQIENNLFENGNSAISMQAIATGADVQNQAIGNTILNSGDVGILSTWQQLPTISRNTIDYSGNSLTQYGLMLKNNDNFIVAGNYILNASFRAIDIQNGNNITGSATNRAKIVNNIIIGSGTNTNGIYLNQNTTFTDIFHNSISITGGSSGMTIFNSANIAVKNNSLALYNGTSFSAGVSAATSVFSAFDYNNFYVTGSGSVWKYGSTTVTAANFQGHSGFNTNSYYGDPGYLDPASDLHVITAQLNNRGDNTVNVLLDFDNQPRPAVTGSPVDIGADEFTLLQNDLLVSDLIAPTENGRVLTSKSLSATQTITIAVTNAGLSPATNIPVKYTVNGAASPQEIIPGPISPGATLNYSFTNKANLAAVGTYNIRAWAAAANDNDRSNDTTAVTQIKQLANDTLNFPFAENFENMPGLNTNASYTGLPGAERFDFQNSASNGRMRTLISNGFAYQGLKAVTFDRMGALTTPPLTHLELTLNLANQTTTDVLMLDFAYMIHRVYSNGNNQGKVWLRGNDNATWVQLYDLDANRAAAGVYKPVTNLNLSTALAAAGQTYSASTQIRFSYSPTSIAANPTYSDGVSFDAIEIRKILQHDMSLITMVNPAPNSCGDSLQTVEVRVKNLGQLTKSNIPVTVLVQGPVNTTFTGIIPGPVSFDQTATFTLGTINTYAGGQFSFTAYTNLTNDENRLNDTLRTSIYQNPIPTSPVAINGTACTGEPVTLQATGTADSYNFYAASTGGAMLANSPTGTFTTPPLTTTTTYYAAAVNTTATEVGPQDNTFGLGGSVNEFQTGPVFNVLRALILDSVYVYPASAGNVKVNLLDVNGMVLATKTVAVTTVNVKTPIALDFSIPAGTGYRLTALGSTVSGLFRNTNSATFPYQVPQTIAITGSSNGLLYSHYYFYDWQITVLECESYRVPVVANITPLPVVDLGGSVQACGGTGATALLDAGNAGTGFTYLWSQGSTSQTISVASSGQYWVQVINPITGCSKTDTVQVAVGVAPVVALGNNIVQCGGTTVLDAGNAGSGFSYLWSGGSTTQTISPATSGQYWVKVTDPATGCFSTDTISVTINAVPLSNLAPVINQCGGPVTLNAGNAGFNYQWSTGATTQTINVTASGIYSVTVTDPVTGCTATSQAQVTINALPAVSLGPDQTLCANNVTLNAGNAGNGFTYLWNTGATTQTISAAASGQYFVKVTNPASNCFSTDTINVTLNQNPVVNIAASGPTTICQGDSVTLTASGGGTYLWSNGATSQSIHVKNAGTYSVTATTAAGCSATSAGTSITVNTLPTVTASPDTVICAGSPVTLTAAGSGTIFTWSTGQTGSSITVNPTANTTYTVSAGTSLNSCTATDQVVVTVNPVPVTPTITVAGKVLTSSSATGNQWYLNGTPISGATSQQYTPTVSGNYSVQTTDANCTSAMSATLAFTMTGIATHNFESQLSVYPNPTQDVITIKLSGITKPVTLSMYNLTGQLLQSKTEKPDNRNELQSTFDLGKYAQGIYLLKLEADGKTVYRKVLRD